MRVTADSRTPAGRPLWTNPQKAGVRLWTASDPRHGGGRGSLCVRLRGGRAGPAAIGGEVIAAGQPIPVLPEGQTPTGEISERRIPNRSQGAYEGTTGCAHREMAGVRTRRRAPTCDRPREAPPGGLVREPPAQRALVHPPAESATASRACGTPFARVAARHELLHESAHADRSSASQMAVASRTPVCRACAQCTTHSITPVTEPLR